MKRNAGYEINFTTNTITMNYKFAAAASVYGTTEYNTLRAIKADFPQMKEIVKAGRTVKKASSHKNLTYKNMEKYISVHDDAEELLAVFASVKIASKAAASPYQYVVDWFEAQFPKYKDALVFPHAEEEKEDGKENEEQKAALAPKIENYRLKKTA